jgi:adenylate kinase family enzyme
LCRALTIVAFSSFAPLRNTILRLPEHSGRQVHPFGGAAAIHTAAVADRIRSADRIHVIGGPGAGKSFFARRLAAASGVELHHLDELAFEGPDFAPRPDEITGREARAIAAQPRWVTEGIFVGWAEPLFERADVIVWLDDGGWGRSARRIASRWLRQALYEAKTRHGAERFLRFGDYARNVRHLVRVLVTSREYWSGNGTPQRYTVTRNQVHAALERHADKVVHLTRTDEAEKVLHLVDPASSDYGSGTFVPPSEA